MRCSEAFWWRIIAFSLSTLYCSSFKTLICSRIFKLNLMCDNRAHKLYMWIMHSGICVLHVHLLKWTDICQLKNKNVWCDYKIWVIFVWFGVQLFDEMHCLSWILTLISVNISKHFSIRWCILMKNVNCIINSWFVFYTLLVLLYSFHTCVKINCK